MKMTCIKIFNFGEEKQEFIKKFMCSTVPWLTRPRGTCDVTQFAVVGGIRILVTTHGSNREWWDLVCKTTEQKQKERVI